VPGCSGQATPPLQALQNQVGVQAFENFLRRANQFAGKLGEHLLARRGSDDRMLRYGLEKEQAAQFQRLAHAVALKDAAIQNQLDQSAQDFVIGADADVGIERRLQFGPPRAGVLLDKQNQIRRRLPMARVLHVNVARVDLIAALVTQS
jgi:hypothetical protein